MGSVDIDQVVDAMEGELDRGEGEYRYAPRAPAYGHQQGDSNRGVIGRDVAYIVVVARTEWADVCVEGMGCNRHEEREREVICREQTDADAQDRRVAARRWQGSRDILGPRGHRAPRYWSGAGGYRSILTVIADASTISPDESRAPEVG